VDDVVLVLDVADPAEVYVVVAEVLVVVVADELLAGLELQALSTRGMPRRTKPAPARMLLIPPSLTSTV
jgi:hypothetical protein